MKKLFQHSNRSIIRTDSHKFVKAVWISILKGNSACVFKCEIKNRKLFEVALRFLFKNSMVIKSGEIKSSLRIHLNEKMKITLDATLFEESLKVLLRLQRARNTFCDSVTFSCTRQTERKAFLFFFVFSK